jgi:hypothetical protein
MERATALALTTFGQLLLGGLAPSVAAVPAFMSFLAAGLILVRT